MFLCVRIDLDYVPWDTPDAEDFGHGEPAMLLRMLEWARGDALKFHFFASNRAMRAFPAEADAVLNEGHDLDWLCKHPDRFAERFDEAHRLLDRLGHQILGMACRTPWDPEHVLPHGHEIRFLSAPVGPSPDGVRLYPVETRPEREAIRSGQSVRVWAEGVKEHLRQSAGAARPTTIVLRPQALAKTDPKLAHTRAVLEGARESGLALRTLRDAMSGGEVAATRLS